MKELELTQFCSLEDSVSLESYLSQVFKCSKNQLKKYVNKSDLLSIVQEREEWYLPLDLALHNQINPNYEGPKIHKLFENDSLLAIDKPINIHCHPLKYTETDNFLSYLRKVSPGLLKVNVNNMDRGLLYRLDYATSGVLWYAKTENIYQQIRENFSKIMKEKNYLVIVQGRFKHRGELSHHLKGTGPKGAIIKVHPQGKLAKLEAELLSYDHKKDLSLVSIRLETGLRHQIRVQLSHLGHPILGDKIYGGLPHERLCLHAQIYTFEIGNENYSAKAANPFTDFFPEH